MFASALGIGSAVWCVYALAKLPWYAVNDPAWQLDVARHVANGSGVVTSVTLPAYLLISGDVPVDANPQLQTPPGYPVALGLALKVFGGSETTAMLMHGVLFVVLLALTFLVARSFVPPLWAAVATILLALDPGILIHATFIAEHNLPFAVGVMATTALLLRTPMRHVHWVGVALGLLQLVRFNAGGLLPAFLLLAYMSADQTQRISRPLRLLIGWAVALAVALLVSRGAGAMSTSGTMSLLLGTSAYPGLTIQGVLSVPTLSGVIHEHLPAIGVKFLAGLRYYVLNFGTGGNPVVAGGVVLSVLLLLRAREARPIAGFVVVATVTTLLIMSFFDFSVAHFAFLLPLYTILVVATTWHFRVDFRLAASVLILIASLRYTAETAHSFRDMPYRFAYTQDLAQISDAVYRLATPSDWIATDVPSTITWHTGLPTVRLPNSPGDLEAMERLRRPVTFLVVTNIEVSPTSQKFLRGAWEPVLDRGALPGFELAQRFDGERIKAVILRRSP